MNETIIQIIPAPSNLMYGYDGGTAQPVACLALVELAVKKGWTRSKGLHLKCGLSNGELPPAQRDANFITFSNSQALANFRKKKDRRCCNTKRPKGKRKVDPPLF